MLFTFFKLYNWYQIAYRITYLNSVESFAKNDIKISISDLFSTLLCVQNVYFWTNDHLISITWLYTFVSFIFLSGRWVSGFLVSESKIFDCTFPVRVTGKCLNATSKHCFQQFYLFCYKQKTWQTNEKFVLFGKFNKNVERKQRFTRHKVSRYFLFNIRLRKRASLIDMLCGELTIFS